MPIPVVGFRDHAFAKTHATEVRSLLRALLREASYLPDSVARHFCLRQASARFRNGRKEFYTASKKSASAQSRHDAEQELRKRIANARSALSVLQRANNGDLNILTKVLMNSYGRTGRRRHELLAPLLRPDVLPENSEALKAVMQRQQESTANSGSIATVPVPNILDAPTINEQKGIITCTISDRFGRLKALASAQSRHNFETRGVLPKLRRCVFEMPAKNTWERQMPRSRIKNTSRKWTTMMLGKLLPPLPEHEWERLNAIVSGQQPPDPVKPRRSRVTSRSDRLSPFDLEQLLLAEDDYSAGRYYDSSKAHASSLTGANTSNLPTLDQQSIIQAPDDWSQASPLGDDALEDILEDNLQLNRRLSRQLPAIGSRNGHNITPKFMRRLLAHVLVQCPHMEKGATGTWNVTWGHFLERPVTPMDFAPLFTSNSPSKKASPRLNQVTEHQQVPDPLLASPS